MTQVVGAGMPEIGVPNLLIEPAPVLMEPQFQGQNPDGVFDYLFCNNLAISSGQPSSNISTPVIQTDLLGFGSVNPDTFLIREAANTLAQRNGANAQQFWLYNTYTDASNFERLRIMWSANVAYIQTEGGGTGSPSRALNIRTVGSGDLNLGVNNQIMFLLKGGQGHLFAATDNTYDIGANGANRPRNVYVAGNVIMGGYISPLGGMQLGNGAAIGSSFWSGAGAPGAAQGVNGDYYFRNDTPGTANQRIYVKSAGAWVGIV